MVWAIVFSMIVSGMIVSHAVYVSAHRQEMDTRYHRGSLSGTFARSGMTDAMSWFRNQSEQPVQSFDPQLDESAVPPIADTIDPRLGLVREFEIHGSLWGRYEVRRADARDISEARGTSTPGTVWEIGARGVVYRRLDPTKPHDQKPNRVVTSSVMRTEIRSVPLRVPAPAAVAVSSPSSVFVENNASIAGTSNPAFAFADTSVLDVPNATIGIVTGTPASVNVPGFDITPLTIFASTPKQLEEFSDKALHGGSPLPTQRQDSKILFVKGSLTIAPGQSFRGDNTLIFVDGDLSAQAGNDTDMSGMIYVSGSATIRGPFKLKGMLVVANSLTVGGSAAAVSIQYDERSVQELTRALGTYRMSRVTQPGIGAIPPVGNPTADIHKDAVVEPTVTHGEFLQVKKHAQVMGSVTIGNNVEIRDKCLIQGGVQIGDNVKIENECQIQDSVQIGDDVHIKKKCIILGSAIIGAGAHIDDECEITGNAIVEPGAHVRKKTVLGDGDVYR